MAADGTYPPARVQHRQDGSLAVPSGTYINIESGGAIKIGDVDMTNKLATAGAVSGTVAAAGTSSATATLIASDMVTVTASNGTSGARLPVLAPGQGVYVINSGSAGCSIYPPTGGTINALTTDAPLVMATLKSCRFICPVTAGAIFSVPLLPS